MTNSIPASTQSEDRSNRSGIQLLSQEEYAAIAEKLYQGKVLLQDLAHIRYAKGENFSFCSQGLIHIPHQQLSFGFYLNAEQLILVDTGSDGRLAEAVKQLENARNVSHPLRLLLELLELLIADDLSMLQQMEQRLSQLEDELLEHIPEHFYQRIIDCRKELSGYHSYYEQMGDLGEQMQQCLCLPVGEEETRSWQLYINRTDRLHNHCERLREYLLQIRELYQSQIEVEQNKTMTFLTVVTTIFLPLTLIAGWYGMNFSEMLALHWRYGYLAVILISAGIVAAEIIYFRRKKML